MEQEPYYADVPADGDLHKALRMLAQMRWIEVEEKGVSSFGPDDPVSREELAVWAAHVLRYDRLAALLRKEPEIASVSDFKQIAYPGAAALAVKLEASFLMKLVQLQASVDQQVHGTSHLLADMLTSNGVKWLFPLYKKSFKIIP